MKEITLRIPESKLHFIKELMKELNIDVCNEVDEFEIPEDQKSIVKERIAKAEKDPKRLLDWDKVQDDFDLDA
ncbi:MAG: hypothetical protein WD048_01400 [Chitinophagales bacterium]